MTHGEEHGYAGNQQPEDVRFGNGGRVSDIAPSAVCFNIEVRLADLKNPSLVSEVRSGQIRRGASKSRWLSKSYAYQQLHCQQVNIFNQSHPRAIPRDVASAMSSKYQTRRA